MERKGPNTAQLRDAIDRGRTGSKVAFPDHAAAPLGTDEEAAGTPPPREAVRQALHDEVTNAGAHHIVTDASRPARWVLAGVIGLGALLVVVAWLLLAL
jgi:hypothetical protein